MRRLILICLLTAACVLGQRTFYGGSIYQPIAAPTTPTLTPIVGGAAGSYTYVIVYRGEDGCVSATATANTTVGPTALDATHTIQINGTPATGPTTMDVYRSVGGTSQGRPFGAIGIPIIIGQPLSYTDVGLQADTNIAPTTPTCVAKFASGATLSMSGTANLSTNTTINGVTAQSITTVTFSATPNFNFGLGDPKLTLTGNVTSSTNSGLVAGRKYHVILCENATGGWTFAAPSTWKGLPSLVTTASVCNYWLLESNDGTNLQWIAGTAY